MQLLEALDELNIPGSLTDRPFASGTNADFVFGMTIDDRETDHERYTIFPGAKSQIQVTDTNRHHNQLVVHVTEPELTFQQDMLFEDAHDLGRRLSEPGVKLLSIDGPHLAHIQRRATRDERAFLLGRDERHRFIAQLPKLVTSVPEAHATLRPSGISTQAKRQGEWFFDPVTHERQHEIEALYHTAACFVRRDAAINNAILSPHVASEIVRIRTGVTEVEVVRGTIIQEPRHRPLHLGDQFHTVHRNLEVQLPRAFGWVD